MPLAHSKLRQRVGGGRVLDLWYIYTAGVPLLVLLMPWALDHLRTVPLRTPPHSSAQLLIAEVASLSVGMDLDS